MNEDEKLCKEGLKTREKEARDLKNKLEWMKNELKSVCDENHKKENETLSEHWKMHLIKNCIEKNTLKPFKVFIIRHNGGDLEGNYIRNLMKNWHDVFDKICVYLSEEKDNKWIGNASDLMTNEEMKKVSFF